MKNFIYKKKSLVAWVAVFILLFNITAFGANEVVQVLKSSINILLNGEKVETKGILIDGYTYIPLRQFAELMGAKVGWSSNTATIDYTAGSNLAGKVSFGEAVDCRLIDKKGITFSLELDRNYDNVKIAFIEDDTGKATDAPVNVVGSLANVTDASEVLLGKTYKLFVLLNNAEIKTFRFKTDEHIKIDLNAARDYFVPANPAKGFNFPYFISFKAGNDLASYKNTVLFDTNNNLLTQNNKQMIDSMTESIQHGSEYLYDIGSKGGYITVMFLFPRPTQDGLLYTHALDRDTLTLTKAQSDKLGRGDLTRLDLQYLAVMKDAKEQLKANGKIVDDKVFLHGFSASADFATRFSLLHPEVVKGIVVNASPTMPFAQHNGVDLKFPLGISDLKQVAGIEFNAEAYKKIPQFWHSGSVDGNDGTYYGDGWGNYGNPMNHWNAEGIDYRKAFGDEITARKRLVSKLLVEKGFTNILFKEYQGVQHEFTWEMQEDALKFLDNID